RLTSGPSGSRAHEPAAPRRASSEPAAAGGAGRPARPRTGDRPPGEADDARGTRLRAAAARVARGRGVAGRHGRGSAGVMTAGPRDHLTIQPSTEPPSRGTSRAALPESPPANGAMTMFLSSQG